jgi:tRNA (guanine37-N1)-methyltransferase
LLEIHILTLFPEMFQGPFRQSMMKRAQEGGLVTISLHSLRDFTHDRHRTADDAPYGGGPGMVLKPEPLFDAVDALRAELAARLGTGVTRATPVILLSPQGRPFTQAVAQTLAQQKALILICGHYEGVDARVEEALATDSLSIGDYVLTGGELPAMVVVDAVVRLLPGVLHHPESPRDDSFAPGMGGLLGYPQYTRPAVYRGLAVPTELQSGDHAAVARWRRRQALVRTWQRRPDLLASAALTPAERSFLETLEKQGQGSAPKHETT